MTSETRTESGVTSLRVYLGIDGKEQLEAIADKLADTLLGLGFNGPNDDSLNAVIACVPDGEDVVAWSRGADEFFTAIKDQSAFILIPTQEDTPDES